MKRDASNASIDEAAYREADEAALLAESSKAAAESSAAAETSPRGGHTVATTVYPPEAVSEPMSPKLEPTKPEVESDLADGQWQPRLKIHQSQMRETHLAFWLGAMR